MPIKKPEKEAAWAKLPPIDKLTVVQAQFFDNCDRPERKKGESDYTLKLFVWTTFNVNLKVPEWWRVSQLLTPEQVIKWARAKHLDDCDALTADQLAVYEEVYSSAVEQSKDAGVDKVWLGHIASPPGKQYFAGQFVFVRLDLESKLTAVVFNNGETFLLNDFKKPRRRGKYVKPGSPKLVCLDDRNNIVLRQKVEEHCIKTGESFTEVMTARLGRD
jgi:hypothetical protein